MMLPHTPPPIVSGVVTQTGWWQNSRVWGPEGRAGVVVGAYRGTPDFGLFIHGPPPSHGRLAVAETNLQGHYVLHLPSGVRDRVTILAGVPYAGSGKQHYWFYTSEQSEASGRASPLNIDVQGDLLGARP